MGSSANASDAVHRHLKYTAQDFNGKALEQAECHFSCTPLESFRLVPRHDPIVFRSVFFDARSSRLLQPPPPLLLMLRRTVRCVFINTQKADEVSAQWVDAFFKEVPRWHRGFLSTGKLARVAAVSRSVAHRKLERCRLQQLLLALTATNDATSGRSVGWLAGGPVLGQIRRTNEDLRGLYFVLSHKVSPIGLRECGRPGVCRRRREVQCCTDETKNNDTISLTVFVVVS